jgi:hypothetical protein
MRRTAGLPGSQPLPEALVSELIAAGISRSTALAMERWKAQEVLELLRFARARESQRWGGGGGEAPAAPLFAGYPRRAPVDRAAHP